MNPFPANSLQDTENERPQSERSTSTTGYFGGGNVGGGGGTGPVGSTLLNRSSHLNNHNHAYNQPQSTYSNMHNTPAQQQRHNITFLPAGSSRWSSSVQKRNNHGQQEQDQQEEEGLGLFLLCEILAVAGWSLAIATLSMMVQQLVTASNQLEKWEQDEHHRANPGAGIDQERNASKVFSYVRWMACWLAWLALRLLPKKLQSQRAPGFFFSHIWILHRISTTFNLYPNFGCRICEWKLGRISKQALILAFWVHVLVPYLFWWLVWLASSIMTTTTLFSLSNSDVDPPLLGELNVTKSTLNPWISLQYEDGVENHDSDQLPFASFFLQEVMVNTIFPIAVMVIPTLLRLNDIPQWLGIFLLYPMYSLGVDGNGRGSTLSPTVFVTQSLFLFQRWFPSPPLKVYGRVLAQLLGNILASIVMQNIFPDDPTW